MSPRLPADLCRNSDLWTTSSLAGATLLPWLDIGGSAVMLIDTLFLSLSVWSWEACCGKVRATGGNRLGLISSGSGSGGEYLLSSRDSAFGNAGVYISLPSTLLKSSKEP